MQLQRSAQSKTMWFVHLAIYKTIKTLNFQLTNTLDIFKMNCIQVFLLRFMATKDFLHLNLNNFLRQEVMKNPIDFFSDCFTMKMLSFITQVKMFFVYLMVTLKRLRFFVPNLQTIFLTFSIRQFVVSHLEHLQTSLMLKSSI